jgi:hypothetical protein
MDIWTKMASAPEKATMRHFVLEGDVLRDVLSAERPSPQPRKLRHAELTRLRTMPRQ